MTSLEVSVHGSTLLMTLNRADKRNAIDAELADHLLEAVIRLDESPDLRVGVIAGNGPTFCAGMDLASFSENGPPRSLFNLVRRGARKPLIAAVDGSAYAGGFEIALMCDIIVASARADFALPEVRRGLIAGAGGLYRLRHRAGTEAAMLAALTGQPFSAERAYALGIVGHLVPTGESVVTAALHRAQQIAANSPLAVQLSKELVLSSGQPSFEQYWSMQRPAMREMGRSRDSVEGARAFIEKREPQWQSV